MWQRKERSMNLPVVEVTASTPLRAHFDDSDVRKDEARVHESSVVDNEKASSGPPRLSFFQRLRLFFHLNREPLPDHSDIYYGKTDWRSIGNLLLAVYATLFSALSLAIAICQPRYGKWIGPTGPLIPSTADVLFSLFAKSIEIASAGVYINFLGQFLTRRSLRSRGIGLPDIAVREWLLQPGFIIWDWENLRYASTTVLGSTSLFAAIAIYFFTTASNSLVSPHIALGPWEATQFSGLVQQNFGNSIVIKKDCWAPIDSRVDSQNIGESCINVLASGLANQDFNNYMKSWAQRVMGPNNATSNLSYRPSASSSIFTDTRVTGNWVQKSTSNVASNFDQYGRVVNNITLSMPHPVVYYSAQVEFPDPVKGTGFGEHTIKASVVSPTSNTLCVNMNRSEVAPLVYVEWPNARYFNGSEGRRIAAKDWEKDLDYNITTYRENITQTGVETIFKWGPVYNRKPPIFPQWPIDFNSIANISVPKSDSIYLLVKSPNTTDYTICQIYGILSSDCSTKHTQKVGASSLSTDCGSDALSYGASIAPATFRPAPSRDFRDVLGAWATAMGLNGGMLSSNSSLVHVLSQFVITNTSSSRNKPTLNPSMPSLSEALAVLSNSMLLKASINATFSNMTLKNPLPTSPNKVPYNIIVQTQQYRSGPPAPWTGILYPILLIMFLANLYCLVYFLREMGLVKDFLEPGNLFGVAVDSPDESGGRQPGEGPVGNHEGVKWALGRDADRRLVYRRVGGGGLVPGVGVGRGGVRGEKGMEDGGYF